MKARGEELVMYAAIVLVFLALLVYWRSPESGGGPQVCAGPPCVEITLPWAPR